MLMPMKRSGVVSFPGVFLRYLTGYPLRHSYHECITINAFSSFARFPSFAFSLALSRSRFSVADSM